MVGKYLQTSIALEISNIIQSCILVVTCIFQIIKWGMACFGYENVANSSSEIGITQVLESGM